MSLPPLRAILAGAAATAVLACSDGGTAPKPQPTPPVSSVFRVTLAFAAPGDTALDWGGTLRVVATAYTAANTVFTDSVVTYQSSAPAVATVDQGGVVTAGSTAGTTWITATAGGVASPALLVTVSGPHITVLRGPPASVTVGSTDTVAVRLTRNDGTPVANTAVTFGTGSGSVTPGTATTDANGIASAVWTLGTVAGGGNVLSIQTHGSAQSVVVTTVPGPAAAVVFSNRLALAGVGGTAALAGSLQDAYGNSVTGTPTYVVRSPGIATVGPDGTATATAAGQTVVVATFPGARPDSLLLVDVPSDGMALAAATNGFGVAAGATVTLPVSVLTPTTNTLVGSFSGTVHWDPAVLALQSAGANSPSGGVAAVAADSAAGHATLTFASASGVWPNSVVLTLTFKVVGPAGSASALSFAADEVHAANTYANALPSFVAVSQPLAVR